MVKKLALVILSALLIGTHLFSYTPVRADGNVQGAICFHFSATLTNPSATNEARMGLLIGDGSFDFSNPTVSNVVYRGISFSVPPSGTRDMVIDGVFGDIGSAYDIAFDANGTGGADISNMSFSYQPCTDLPMICFSYSATWASYPVVSVPFSLKIADAPFLSIPQSEISLFYVQNFAALGAGEVRNVTIEGSFTGQNQTYFTSVQDVTVTNESFTYEQCGGGNRLNAEDVAAPAALYMSGDNLQVYAINPITAQGIIAINVTPEEIDTASAQAVASGQNQLIAENMGVALYALSTGECQVNGFYSDGNVYDYQFPCP